jgi:hypothetical protein
MNIKELRAILETKDQLAEIEFIICKNDGEVVATQLNGKVFDIEKLMKATVRRKK